MNISRIIIPRKVPKFCDDGAKKRVTCSVTKFHARSGSKPSTNAEPAVINVKRKTLADILRVWYTAARICGRFQIFHGLVYKAGHVNRELLQFLVISCSEYYTLSYRQYAVWKNVTPKNVPEERGISDKRPNFHW